MYHVFPFLVLSLLLRNCNFSNKLCVLELNHKNLKMSSQKYSIDSNKILFAEDGAVKQATELSPFLQYSVDFF